jgi:hypothetical protein
VIVTSALAWALVGCGPTTETSNSATEAVAEQVVAVNSNSDNGRSSRTGSWTSYATVDPLTDVETTIANRMFRSGAYIVQLEVTCDSTNWVTYTATVFDEEGYGAPVDWAFGRTGMEFLVQTRVDQDDATTWIADKRRYSNQFKLTGPTKLLARGMALTMRFAMPNEDATIFVDEGDPVFRHVVGPCLETVPNPEPPATASPEGADNEDATLQPPNRSTNADEVNSEGVLL